MEAIATSAAATKSNIQELQENVILTEECITSAQTQCMQELGKKSDSCSIDNAIHGCSLSVPDNYVATL